MSDFLKGLIPHNFYMVWPSKKTEAEHPNHGGYLDGSGRMVDAAAFAYGGLSCYEFCSGINWPWSYRPMTKSEESEFIKNAMKLTEEQFIEWRDKTKEHHKKLVEDKPDKWEFNEYGMIHWKREANAI